MIPRALTAAAAGSALLLTFAACGGSAGGADGDVGAITVFAASSLTKPFTELGAQFEAARPGTAVRFNFAGSADLVSQVQQGAPADVLATADTATMATAVANGVVEGAPQEFARNSMTIAVPPDNPAGIAGMADLAEPGVRVVICAPEVPCGAAAGEVQRKSGVALTPVSEESSVTDVMNKVLSGEADAGLVYVTDVRAAGDRATGIEIPARDNAVNVYPIAAPVRSGAPAAAGEFRDFVLGPEGQRALADAGFDVG